MNFYINSLNFHSSKLSYGLFGIDNQTTRNERNSICVELLSVEDFLHIGDHFVESSLNVEIWVVVKLLCERA